MFSRRFLTASYRISAQSTVIIQKITCHRSLHLACRNLRRDLVLRKRQNRQFPVPVISATFIRYISDQSAETENASASAVNTSMEDTSTTLVTEGKSELHELLTQIPEPPKLVQEIIETVVKTSEPTLQDLQLGSWYPPGIVQQCLDLLHTNLGLPWWESIIIFTICLRILILPLNIKMQKNQAILHNIQPQTQYLQAQISDARYMGDTLEVARLSQELNTVSKDKGVNPLGNLALPLLQAPIFISVFLGLRGMVNAPIESMKEGGILWFTDLTVPDPYYLLPILTALTTSLTLEVGTDTQKMAWLGNARYLLRMVPYFMLLFTINFEGGILLYWLSVNVISLIQVGTFKIPKVRTYLNIPVLIQHDKKKLLINKKGFRDSFKDAWTNMKVTRDLNSRIMYDETVFEKAGRGPVPKTYKENPRKQHQVTSAILSKKRD